ncbi:putative LysR family transcriptional regulator [Gordonia rhizosphera NBRC 16068]|uniref:Putative LysR family transcriptional regulator n=2 Tax=Gordonia rhizosphera TaxID=83341 RepID=K6VZK6_9ACTN|nr:putative LysR family transcriptional regulator [Gordonia rhizosphera NBRC 16068]
MNDGGRTRNDLDLRRLRMFVTVADSPSLRVAADDLYITQQAVSSAIKELERNLGVELFSRSRRSLTLTAAGEALYHGALPLLAGGDQLTAKMRLMGTDRPIPFVIGHTPDLAPSEVFTIIEPVVLSDPAVPITVRPVFADRIHGELLHGEIDLALRRGVQSPPGLAGTVAAHHQLHLAVRTDHPLAQHDRITLRDLAEHDIVMSEAEEDTEYTQILISTCQGAGFEPRVVPSTLRGTPPHTGVITHPDACVFVTNEPGWIYGHRIRVIEFDDPPIAPVQALWLPHTSSEIRRSILDSVVL